MKKIIVTGGGTGGHFYPALSIIESINDFCHIKYCGHPHKIESKLAPMYGIKFIPLSSYPFNQHILQYTKILISVVRGILILMKEKPDLVIGVGGYVSIPLMVAAKIVGTKSILHEQNVHMGMANRLLAKLGVTVMLSFAETVKEVKFRNHYVTGCPVRNSIGAISRLEARKKLEIDHSKKIVLIVGGSGGALKINNFAEYLIDYYSRNDDVYVILVTGTKYYKQVSEKMNNASKLNFKIIGYADDMDLLYSASDLVICRSGSSTINELLCAGKPSVLIPSPNVAENHQESNARLLEKFKASRVFLENHPKNELALMIDELLFDENILRKMSINNLNNCKGKNAKIEIRKVIMKKLGAEL